jgi:hypothetical protein
MISLCFSNDDKTPLEIQLTSDHQLINLHSLTLRCVFSINQKTEIISKLNSYPNLVYLKLIDFSFQLDDNTNGNIIDEIWNLSKLKHVYISSTFCQRHVSIYLSVRSLTIKSISIQNIFLNEDSLNNLFKFTHYLQCLNASIENSNKYNMQYIPHLVKFKFIGSKREPYHDQLIKEDALINLLKSMPKLYYLSVETSCMWLDGYQWEYLITNYMPKLEIFKCKMERSLDVWEKEKNEINNLLRSFQTRFWITTHKWFIRCHWDDKNSYSHRLLYHTLPYTFRQLIVLNNYQWSTSTSPYNSDDHWLLNSIHRLEYHSISSMKDDSIKHFQPLFKTRSISCFTTIYELTISSGLDDKYLSYFITKFDQLNSLHILNDIEQYQLQILLDHAPNLSSLSIHDKDIFSKFFLYNIKSRSIYQLNLRKIRQNNTSIAYDMEKCIALTRSPLGKQCEILTIEVKDNCGIIYLIKNMINLRILKVYCPDYQHYRLVQWLELHLPPTMKIKRYQFPIDTIHIWIKDRFDVQAIPQIMLSSCVTRLEI